MAVLQRHRPKARAGSPAWIVTFADLATLMLTFFILLLSFAEMDVEKYRAMANSMASAFGSGNGNVLGDSASGSPLTLIESDTVSLPRPDDSLADEPRFIDERSDDPAMTEAPGGIVDLASRLITELESEVASQALSINYDTRKVVIRFAEDATFQSGQATLKSGMVPIIERVVDVLSSCTGDVLVAGYTDDQPIVSSRYRSNWDLSAARAVSVVHELVMNRALPAERVIAAGRAETNPLVPNDSPENRARNRRVEIAIRDPACQDSIPSSELPVEILP